MDLKQGNLFWNEKTGIIKTYPYLDKDIVCDVLIIGGGITGAITAFIQAKQNANVIIVDKNLIGYNETLRTDGIIETRIDFNSKAIKNLSNRSINKCNNLYKDALKDIENIINEILTDDECKKYVDSLAYKKVDLIYYSDRITNRINMYKTFEKLGKEDKNIEYLEDDPILNLRTGIIFPNSGISINLYVLTQLIMLYLSKKENVKIYENTKIYKINSKEDNVESITSNKFKIYSKNVILTNGVHSLEYIKEDNVSLNKTFTIVTDKINEIDYNNINIIAKDVNQNSTSITFTKDKRIIFSGESVKQNEKLLNEKYFEIFANGRYKKLFLELNKILNVDEIKLTNCFCGMYLETKDNLPIIDEIDNLPNVYCNLPSGKNGIVHSMIGAKMLKDITKRYNSKDMYMFRENR